MNKPVIEEIIVVEGRDDTAAIRQAVDAVTIETHGFGIREEIWEMIDRAYRTKGIIVFTDPDTAGDLIRGRILERFPQAKEAFLDQAHAAKAGDIGIENASPESIREALGKVHGTVGSLKEQGAGGSPEDHGFDMSPKEQETGGLSREHGTVGSSKAHGAIGSSKEHGTVGLHREHSTNEPLETHGIIGSPKEYENGTLSKTDESEGPFSSADLFRWGLDGVPGASKRRSALGQRLGIGQATAKTFLRRLNRFGIQREEIEAALDVMDDFGY